MAVAVIAVGLLGSAACAGIWTMTHDPIRHRVRNRLQNRPHDR